MSERVITVGGNQASRILSEFAMENIGTGKAFYVDPTNGDDGRSGRSPETAVASLATGYGLLTTGSNDILYIIPSTSGLTVTAELTWSKSYCHLVGLSAPCMNLRARFAISSPLLPIRARGFMHGADKPTKWQYDLLHVNSAATVKPAVPGII